MRTHFRLLAFTIASYHQHHHAIALGTARIQFNTRWHGMHRVTLRPFDSYTVSSVHERFDSDSGMSQFVRRRSVRVGKPVPGRPGRMHVELRQAPSR